MKSILIAAGIVTSLGAQLAFAHGEDKPGPNGGFIRMPSAFHTELVPTGSSSLKIYLLDINWKNPTVKASALKVTHRPTNSSGACKVESNFYVCQFSKSVDLTKKGELSVEAKREGQTGATVSYELPLKLQKLDDGHSGHH
jgi:hypothetical protein